MAKKTLIDLSVDNNVAASATDTTTAPAAVPNGKIARITKFGGTAPLDNNQIESLIILQWGSGGTWKTVRGFSCSFAEIEINEEFVGDGTKTFRLVRINRTSAAKPMLAWLKGFIV